MPGFGETLSDFARFRKQFETAGRPMGGLSPDSDLTELTDFGPNPGDLLMQTFVPDGLPPLAPLVVVLHGCTQTAASYDHGAGWTHMAAQFGFAVLLPEQQRANNPNLCFNWFLPEDTRRDHGEVASIKQMIDRMILDHGLDPKRVFVTGLSAGGAMTSALLACYPETFAAGAIIAGLPYGCASNTQQALSAMFQGGSGTGSVWGDMVRGASSHTGPWPRISVWHGSADTTVKPTNAAEIVKQWIDVHGASSEPTVKDTVSGFPHRVRRPSKALSPIASAQVFVALLGLGEDAAGLLLFLDVVLDVLAQHLDLGVVIFVDGFIASISAISFLAPSCST
jgi:poly(hydroxyalkanoate) depolymerase family esterase